MGVGLWAPERRSLTAALVLTITLVAFEALAVITILPLVEHDLGHLGLYGWVTSAFFLGTLVGIVVAGGQADRRGPATPFLAGIGLFGAGLLVGGLAPSMLVLVAGRAVQGLGAGAIPAVAYATIGRAYPEGIRPRVFAVMSTAWVVPGLIGPAISALVAERFGWRAVLLGLLPLVGFAAALSLVALRRYPGPADPPPHQRRLPDALLVAAGAGLVLAGLETRLLPLAAVMIAGGAVLGVPSLRRLLPDGTFRARPGLPAVVLLRGLATFSFFGADAYVPLSITSVHERTVAVASLAVTAATLTWTAGAWTQERRATRVSSRGFVRSGLVIVVLGIATVAASLAPGAPVALAIAGWGVGGFGMGMGYAPLSLLTLRHAPAGAVATATAALQLSDNLGVALGAGVGGAAVAVGATAGRPAASGLAVAFAITGAVGVLACVLARRLPGGVMPPAP